MIGMLGEVIFNVSFDGKNKKILNFTNLKLSGRAKRVNIVKPIFTEVNTFQVAKEVNINPRYGGVEDD